MATKQIVKEPIYQSRRLWGAVAIGVSGALIFAFPDHESTVQTLLEIGFMFAGIALPTWSWTKPKA